MPECMVVMTRRPLEGQVFSVLEEQVQSIASIAQSENTPIVRGLVTVTVGNQVPEGIDVTTNLIFRSYPEYDDFQSGLMDNEAYIERFDSIASKCQFVSIDLCEIIRPIEGAPEGFNAKYLVRNVFTAKPGKRSELIDVLVEQRESLTPGSPKANITKPLSSWDQIRSGRAFDSYQALAESLSQIESPANRSGWGRVVDLTDQMTRTISKIQYIM
ncbi:hypothetical protein FIM07_03905 [SAR202 cluster bacterium AD-802-F09_MRT_200m]|mgnify:FL=1|jgi:hypothetical protein|nr:hypothetical protein [SAR202 cluster bacterium AD-802-F09_MRT_200m]